MAAVSYEDELYARRQMVLRVRERARDWDELNRLIKGEEHSDRLILLAIQDVVEDFNTSPPPVGTFFVANFPSLYILTQGVLAILLESAAVLYARNDVAYAHAGTSVQFNQASTYMMLSQQMWGTYEAKKRELKVALNAQQAVAATGGTYTSLALTYRPTWRVYNLLDYGSTS